jgi:hypothetical protein
LISEHRISLNRSLFSIAQHHASQALASILERHESDHL